MAGGFKTLTPPKGLGTEDEQSSAVQNKQTDERST